MKYGLRAIAITCLITMSLPSLAAAPKIWIHSVYGDRETVFTIMSSKKPVLQFSNNLGKQESTRLSKENYGYIVREIAGLSDAEKGGSNCPRSRIEVMALTNRGVKHVVTCINSPLSNTTRLLRLTNLLGVIL